MIEDQNEHLTALKNLVLTYEYEERELRTIPQEEIDFFGYACLSNSLMFKEPQIPAYNQEDITKYFQSHSFNTLDSLISYINGLKNDIDKLFAIFSWEAMNIKYDVEALLTGEQRDKSLEAIFANKAAVCEGYCLFFREMVKKTNIDHRKVKVRNYYSYAKPYNYDPNNIPTEVDPNHCSLFIQIDYIPYISDPSRAAGHLTSDNTFEVDYNPSLFLIPLVKTINDRMPCDDFLIPFKFTLEDFFKSCRISPVGLCLKTESNPFVQVESSDGYLSQIYSCTSPLNWIQINLLKRDPLDLESFDEIECENITSYEVVQQMIPNHQDRCRIRTNISFPEEGYYRVEVFVDSVRQLAYYVNCHSKSEMPVPITYNPFINSKFVPIKPYRILSRVKHGVALIRFAVSKKRSDILWNIIKLNKNDTFDDQDGQIISREFGKFLKLELPFDESRVENQLVVNFPSDGRYSVQIYLANESSDSFSNQAKYFIDVEGTQNNENDHDGENTAVISPIDFLFANRKIATISACDANKNPIGISPNMSCRIIDDQNGLKQFIEIETFSENQKVLLEFRKNKDSLVCLPSLKSKEEKKNKFEWEIPNEEGEYKLVGFIDETFAFSILYVYRKKALREETEEEVRTINELKQKVELDNEYEKVFGKSDSDNDAEVRKSSKCCLLI